MLMPRPLDLSEEYRVQDQYRWPQNDFRKRKYASCAHCYAAINVNPGTKGNTASWGFQMRSIYDDWVSPAGLYLQHGEITGSAAVRPWGYLNGRSSDIVSVIVEYMWYYLTI